MVLSTVPCEVNRSAFRKKKVYMYKTEKLSDVDDSGGVKGSGRGRGDGGGAAGLRCNTLA